MIGIVKCWGGDGGGPDDRTCNSITIERSGACEITVDEARDRHSPRYARRISGMAESFAGSPSVNNFPSAMT